MYVYDKILLTILNISCKHQILLSILNAFVRNDHTSKFKSLFNLENRMRDLLIYFALTYLLRLTQR